MVRFFFLLHADKYGWKGLAFYFRQRGL